MPTVILSISDLRLPVGRESSVIVRCVQVASSNEVDPTAIEVVANVRRSATKSVEIELAPGTWHAIVTSAYLPESAHVLTVPNTVEPHCVNLVIGDDSTQSRFIRHEVRQDAHLPYGLTARGRLSPSRGSASLPGSHRIVEDHSDMFLITYLKPAPEKPRPRFSNATNFASRLNYWMCQWQECEELKPTHCYAPQIRGGETGNLRVLNLELDLWKNEHPLDGRKALLRIKILDQFYSVILPQVAPDESGNFGAIVLEISFVSESVKCDEKIDRLKGIKFHTMDPNFNAVTQFLAKGEMPNALKIWKTLAEAMLQNKYEDPVAAAAAGLVLVHASLRDELPLSSKVRWEHWIHNLSNDFPTISDSAVGDAWINALKVGDHEAQMADASRAFESAVHRGLPVFSESIRLLKRGAEWAFENSANSDELAAIRWLTRQAVSGTALTTIRHEEL